jgi:hypothetical protein
MASVRAHHTTINRAHAHPFVDLDDPPIDVFVQVGSNRGTAVVSEVAASTAQFGRRHYDQCHSLEDGGVSMPALGEGCWCITIGGGPGYDGSPGRAD